jgi:hypothetical protein
VVFEGVEQGDVGCTETPRVFYGNSFYGNSMQGIRLKGNDVSGFRYARRGGRCAAQGTTLRQVGLDRDRRRRLRSAVCNRLGSESAVAFGAGSGASGLRAASDSEVIVRAFHERYFPTPGCLMEGVVFHHGNAEAKPEPFHTTRSQITVDETVANGASVEFASRNPDKQPLRFDIHEAFLRDVGWKGPLRSS